MTPTPTLNQYITGFVASIVLTVAAYLLVVGNVFSGRVLIGLIVALALIQFTVQLVYFLHLGQEAKPRWRLYVFLFMVMVVAILVFGSLWIMSNLNYRLTPAQQNQYIQSQDGF